MSPSPLEAPLAEMTGDPDKVRLLNLVRQLCDRHEWTSHGKPRTPAVLAMLTQEACERAIAYKLSSPGRTDGTRFDPAYGAKSELATNFILSRILDRLKGAGYAVGVAAEDKDPTGIGTYDVVVLRGNPCLIMRGGEALVRVEVKASLGIGTGGLAQVSRYLLAPSPLVLARVQLDQVIVLKPQDLGEFVAFTTELLASRATRILQNSPYVVPGPSCRGCPDRGCPYNESIDADGPRLVAMKEEAFEEDLLRFYRNLPGVCERTAQLVLEEVRIRFKTSERAA